MKETLWLPAHHEGRLWIHQTRGIMRRPHHHTELELNLVTQGTAAYLLGDRRYDLGPGTLVWLFPEQDHVLLAESPDFGMWIGLFRPALIARACTTPESRLLCEPDPPGAFCARLPEPSASRLRALFTDLEARDDDTALFNAGLGYALLAAWRAFGEAGSPSAGASLHPAVDEAVRLLRQETDDLTVAALARRVGLSESRLSRLFARQVGTSIADFRNAQRLERFFRLRAGDRRLSLLVAALEAGWGSYGQFHRVFKQRVGCSPADYERR